MVPVTFFKKHRMWLIPQQPDLAFKLFVRKYGEDLCLLFQGPRVSGGGITDDSNLHGNPVLKPTQSFQSIGYAFLLTKRGRNQDAERGVPIPGPRAKRDIAQADSQMVDFDLIGGASQFLDRTGHVWPFAQDAINLLKQCLVAIKPTGVQAR